MCWSLAMQKYRVNLTCSVCARCGGEVLCEAENAVFGRVQTSACERAKNCAQMDPNRLTCLIGHWNRSLSSKINSPLPSRSSAAARLLTRSHVHAPTCAPTRTLPCARSRKRYWLEAVVRCSSLWIDIPRHLRTLHSQCLRIAHCCTLHLCTTH